MQQRLPRLPSSAPARFRSRRLGALLLLALGCIARAGADVPAKIEARSQVVPGLSQPVEIPKDRWGISHIYAQNEDDLFFAQGYSAARDRLFQLELWRLQATGTAAEVLGSRELKRDIGARLHQFRGDLSEELSRYHPRGEAIVAAFVKGINAYIAEALRNGHVVQRQRSRAIAER